MALRRSEERYKALIDSLQQSGKGTKTVGSRGDATWTRGRKTDKALRRFGFADGASPLVNAPDAGYVPIARHGMIVAYASCPPKGWTTYAPLAAG